MKHMIRTALFSLFSLSLCAQALANSQDEQIELEVHAAALATLNQAPLETERSLFGIDLKNPFDFLKGYQEQLQGIKDMMLSSYDENGNGKIDAGTEFDNFKSGMQMLLTMVADKNSNGKIDMEDVGTLSKEAFEKVRAQMLTKVCPFIHDQADKAGIFLKLNPLLVHFDKVCTSFEETLED